MRVLNLTSPNMQGDDVANLQYALRNNEFGVYFSDPANGVYGELTAAAVKRAKYWLGYQLKNVNREAGDLLLVRLQGKSKLSLAMRLRRSARLKQAAGTPLRVKALNAAIAQLGIKESPPESNIVKFSAWYGMVGPWCAMFVTWAYVQAGSKSFYPKLARWAYCPYMVSDARAGRNGLELVSAHSVQPGDIVLFDWNGGVADHVGLFEKWIKLGVEFSSIEGNTSLGNDSNGGEVMRRARQVYQVECFVHVTN